MGIKDIVVGRISERDKENWSRSYDKVMTMKWKFSEETSIRVHMSYNNYSPPPGMECNNF